MDENEYRQTYREVNERKCVFEKAINSRRCNCSKSRRFNLADREGVACDSSTGFLRCQQLIQLLRSNASFALQMTKVPGPLPHAKEIKVQVGGMLGVQTLFHAEKTAAEKVDDIDALAAQAESEYGTVESLPFTQIVKSIVQFEGRLRRRSRNH